MCRLLGYVTTTPCTIAGLLGPDELREFTELACQHGDGWGAAWAEGAGVGVRKAPDAANVSEAFRQHAHGHEADLGLVHLRWATHGLAVRPANTHPFTDGNIAFAHNGAIRPPAELDAMIPPDLSRLRAGDTDSERYFLAALGAARSAGNLLGGLAATAARIAAACQFTCLNVVVVTPDELLAVCRYDEAALAARGGPPDYFQLVYRQAADSVVVASTGWGTRWTSLGNGEILIVRRDTLEVSVTSVTAVTDQLVTQLI
jgi:predicted glutamine amidotransferase